MAKTVAVYLYGAGIALAAVLALGFLFAFTSTVNAKFGVLEVAYSFAPMLLLMAGAFRAQRAAAKAIWPLVPAVLLAAGLLLFALLNHGLPERAILLAVPHVVIAVPLGLYLLAGRSSQPPSNSTPHADARDVPAHASSVGARAGGRER
jgi:hypothetical protein